MTEFERYLFDLQGFLVIENVLNRNEGDAIALDRVTIALDRETIALYRVTIALDRVTIALYRVTITLYRVLPNLLRVPLRLPPRSSAFKFKPSIPHDFTQ